MIEKLRIFGLLLHKGWLFRTTNFWFFPIELLLPLVSGVLCIFASIAGSLQRPGLKVKYESHYRLIPLEELLSRTVNHSSMQIYYVPNKNSFTDELMTNVNECFERKANITGFATETEFMTFHEDGKFSSDVAVIFDESIDQSVKHLRYTLRFKRAITSLYNTEIRPKNMTLYYLSSQPRSTQMQLCLDRSFISMKSGKKPIPRTYMQQVPSPAHNYTTEPTPFDDRNRTIITYFLIIFFILPLSVGIVEVITEEKTGVRVLLLLNGVSNTLYLLGLIATRLILLSVICVIPISLFLANSPYAQYGNWLILFLVFIFYLAHLLTFSVHVSAYWSYFPLVTIVLAIFNFLTVIFRATLFTDDKLYLVPYLGIIFPDGLFYQAMEEISNYEIKAEGIHWYNLFMSTNPAIKEGSVGGVLILSVIGTIFHFLLAIYVYTISPGKYGVARHPLYFLKFKRKNRNNSQKYIETLEYDGTNQYFESIPTGIYVPGIQIRNLKKVYNVGLFDRQKIHALQDVSVDFYKGQITSLLGHTGAGKTTLISILTGLTNLTEGEMFIDSKDLKENTFGIRKDIRVCTKVNMYFSKLSVWDQVLLIARINGRGKSKSSIRSEVEVLLQKLQLFGKKDVMPDGRKKSRYFPAIKGLSYSQKRQLCIALTLVGDSSILILDEPTSEMDPEIRRVIWDTILEMRGQKTILISTYDAEEAEILGDRIAILHAGQLISYGSSQFLNRLIGRNNVEIACSITPISDPERIRRELGGTISSIETSKIIINIPNSSGLPDTLDNLEKKKKDLGVVGFGVSSIGLEQIFLKITEENGDISKSYPTEEKLTGLALCIQTVRALLSKKLIYTLKDRTSLLKIIATLGAVTVTAFFISPPRPVSHKVQEMAAIPMKLDIYPEPQVLYTSHDKKFGDQYKSISQSLGGNPIEITDCSLTNALLQHAKDNIISYEHNLIAAAEFNQTAFNALYSGFATFSIPISINLLSNTILKNLASPDYSITLSIQELPDLVYPNNSLFVVFGMQAFAFIFTCMISIFVLHPWREFTTGIKQLQKMAGISGFTYWGILFLVDLIEYAFLVVLTVTGFVCMDMVLGLRMFGLTEVLIEVLLLISFGISGLPFVYAFSFMKFRYVYMTTIAISMLLLTPFVQLNPTSDGLPHLGQILMLIPHINLKLSQTFFFATAYANAMCHRLPNEFYDKWCQGQSRRDICCDLDCYDGKCKKLKQFFDDGILKTCLIYFCVTSIVYFGIVAVLEKQLIAKCFSYQLKGKPEDSYGDEQVRREKLMVFDRIETLSDNQSNLIQPQNTNNSDNYICLAYELQKKYLSAKAVKNISFGVNQGECFGILGSYNVGSSVIRMITGMEIPDRGKIYVGDKDLKRNKKYCLSQMGYCPQDDATLECLNSYDHLRLFARLRGISEKQVENEVQRLIEQLSLSSCSFVPSGRYSRSQKRLLNIAMGLIGNPKLILMDEPTMGMEPATKRLLWNLFKTRQATGQAIILSSQNTEECEALCDRLAIMIDGKFVSIGAPEELKQRYGAGYDVQIILDTRKAEMQVDSIKRDMSRMLNGELIDENLSTLLYHVAPAGTTWRKLYNAKNEMKNKYDSIFDILIISSLRPLLSMFDRAATTRSYTSQSTN